MTDFDYDEYAAQVDALFGTVEIAPLAAVLDELVEFIDRFMHMTAHQLDATALWTAHTHVADVLDVAAYLHINSPGPRCGKSTLVEILTAASHIGVSTTNISTAALFRLLDQRHPTLFIDEIEHFLGKDGKKTDPSKADIVALINSGYRRGQPTYRMGGSNMRELETFDSFGPKALAGVGSTTLPDTTADRCVPIRLRRKTREVTKDRWRLRTNLPEATALGLKLHAAVRPFADDIKYAWPALPDELNDRAQDIWEALLAIADAAAGDWPKRAREAALGLRFDAPEDGGIGAQLLADIRGVFVEERLLTAQLVGLLNALEEAPWADYNKQKGITSAWLVRQLKNYELRSKQLRAPGSGTRGRGFERASFIDVFDAYLPPATKDDD